MENLICQNVGKKYKDKVVLKDVNLTLEPGKIYGLIGRNGAGKTTLLSMMSAQNPLSSGNILYGSEPVWENPKALSHICFSRELNPTNGNNSNNMKVKEYLQTAAIYYPHWDKEMATELLDLFELDIKKQIGKLSKGMMSMVAIIVALASKADYTFLDEPVAGLDIVARDLFYKLLLEEYQKTGRTFVVSTHIIDEASDIFEEVIIINQKNIMLKENTIDLLERAFYVNGKAETVDQVTLGKRVLKEEMNGRSKGATVLLEEGQTLDQNADVTIQSVTLQNLFVALCGKEVGLHDRV